MTLTLSTISELERLYGEATKGEWSAFCRNGVLALMKGSRPRRDYQRWKAIIQWNGFDSADVVKRERVANLYLIASLHNNFPALLASARYVHELADRAITPISGEAAQDALREIVERARQIVGEEATK